jgi:heme/copper-type cytochrome/quinol oxidase subunit 1
MAWLWLAEASDISPAGGRRPVLLAYTLGVLCAVTGVNLSLLHSPADAAHVDAFTKLMKHGNGLPAILVGAVLLRPILLERKVTLPIICLISSMALFAAGGTLGHMIAGSNEIVPAHYHGSIVGVTLALMGAGYLLLPQLGCADVASSKLAKWQPVLYGGGQLCWMMGMAIGGSQGIGRKIPGSADVIGGFGGFLKHSGDGLSLIGGLLFVFIIVRAFKTKN